MRNIEITGSIVAMLAILLLASGLMYEYREVGRLSQSVAALQVSVDRLTAGAQATSSPAAVNSGNSPVISQPVPKPAAQTLESAVAKVTPAVVSIVETQVVPQLEVTYVNPFGNDPFFQGFGLQVPVYRQVGTTTRQVSAGTGFLVRSNGYIITNKHVVANRDATYTVLLSNGKQKLGTVVWRSPGEDLAVIKIAGSGYATVPLGNSAGLKLGQSVFAVGNALGRYNNTVSTGIISGLNRNITATDQQGNPETLSNVIQTDTAINPGNSGGPLVTYIGEAIGVNVAVVQGGENISFALPINKVKTALAELGL
ncbi:trypsin-like peptidase domain-containing protein [Candidatus Kaiserbacteria bacterium]|nr:trypsin-like peptidase domain-containing protein [Candidatus Kaiserbacteria bacterium]